MKQTLEGRYPAKSDVVMKMLTDRKFYTDRLDLQGIKGYEVLDHAFDGKDFSVKIKRKVSGINVTSTETWNVATKNGTITVDLQGMPIQVTCETSVKDDGKGSVLTYKWDVNSKVPLIGGKIEKQFAGENEKAIPEQTRLGIQLLKNYS
jgi:carbon monoxide dehydrogenase subunit G